MKKRALAIALALSAAGAGLIQLYLHRVEQELSGGTPRPVLFMRRDVPAGAVLTEDAVGERAIPQSYLSPRHVLASDLNRVLGTTLSAGVSVNDALMWTDLAVMHEDRSLADLIQDGMRAVPLRASGFEGLLRPGDRVDVLFVASQRAGEEMEKRFQVGAVLQNVLILAIGSNLRRDVASEARGNTAVTLLLTVEQAELLAVSEKHGDLQLVLRNPADVTVRDELAAVTSEDLADPAHRSRIANAGEPEKLEEQEAHHAQ